VIQGEGWDMDVGQNYNPQANKTAGKTNTVKIKPVAVQPTNSRKNRHERINNDDLELREFMKALSLDENTLDE
jgi:hypothetical protein